MDSLLNIVDRSLQVIVGAREATSNLAISHHPVADCQRNGKCQFGRLTRVSMGEEAFCALIIRESG